MEAIVNYRIRLHRLWPTWSILLALTVIFFGEHVFSGSKAIRLSCDGLGGLALVAALIGRGLELGQAQGPKKVVSLRLFACSLGPVVSMLLYALIPLLLQDSKSKPAIALAWASWPMVLILSLLPLLAMEMATWSVAFNQFYEQARVRSAYLRGLSLALLVCVLFFVNYLGTEHEIKWDVSYGQKASASDITKRAVRELTSDIEIVEFFPRTNEVADALNPYFDSLLALSPHLKLKRVDFALSSQLAHENQVTENGMVALARGKIHDKIRLGDKLNSARSALHRFDANFLASLLKVTKGKQVAYFTVGHEERSTNPNSKDTRTPLLILKDLLDTNQYNVKPLGVAEGLADKVPADASVVFIMGPEKPFSQPEIDALLHAAEKGTRLFIALEAEREGDPLNGLLSPLGLKFDKTILANEQSNVMLTHTPSDRATIWTNHYSSHESVSTMNSHQRIATIFQKSGALSLNGKPKNEQLRPELVVTTLEDTFADTNGNLEFDETEKKMAYGLGAAISRTSTSGKRIDEERIFVVADVDVFGDQLIKNEGNVVLLSDILYWLRTTEDPVLPPVSSEDVPVMHQRNQDTAWFYSTTLGVPVAVLVFGLVGMRRRRRQ